MNRPSNVDFNLRSTCLQLIAALRLGIPSVQRAVINNLGKGRFNLVVEGTNLQAVMGIEGVKAGVNRCKV